MDTNERRLLTSWKDIARFIDRTVRTCQRWEKTMKLPVYRVNESNRARVYTYANELDEWLKNRIKNNEIGKKPFFEKRGVVLATILVTFSAMIALAAYVFFFSPKGKIDKSEFNPDHIVGNKNIIYFCDKEGTQLWPLEIETGLNTAYSYVNSCKTEHGKLVAMADVNGDSKNEVAFVRVLAEEEDVSLCFLDNTGELKWEKKITFFHKYRDPSLKYQPINIAGLKFADVIKDKTPELLVIWKCGRFPAAFVIYDVEGRELFRYLHTGHLYQSKVLQDKDGNKYIYLTGTNNLLDGDACIAVIDCDDLKSGLAPPFSIAPDLLEMPKLQKYVPVEPQKAHQKYYIRIRKNALSRVTNRLYLYLNFKKIGDEGLDFSVRFTRSYDQLHFSLDSKMRLRSVFPEVGFEKKWNEYYRKGEIPVPLEIYLKRINEDIQFWDGEKWQMDPVPCVNHPD